MAMITRAGVAALTPEEVAKPPKNRHPQDGRFIRKGTAPVKSSGARRAGSINVKPRGGKP